MRQLTIRVVLAGIACGLAAVGRAEVQSLPTEPASGIKVEVEGWTGLRSPVNGRDAGLIPVTVEIVNGSAADRAWTVAARSYGAGGSVQPVVTLAVPAGATARATLFVGGAFGHGWRSSGGFAVTGFGLTAGRAEFGVDCSAASSRHSGALEAGFSRELQAAQGNPFAKYSVTGLPLDMARAPEDWRGWSAFRNVLLTEGEWQSLAGGRRKALLDWAATGGRAGVLVADRAADRLDRLGFPAAGPDGRRRIGAGEVVVVPWDGTRLEAREVERFLDGRTTFEKAIEGYVATSAGQWAGGFSRLYDHFGPRSLPVIPIIAFLAVFGIFAGPINVMVFAGRGRRSRMFWTTPAISLAATACLLGLMFLRDGVGGQGVRRVLGLLAPEQNTMAVIQEQFSRTGVLLGSSFPIAEPAWLQSLGRQDDRGDVFLEVDGRTRRGDWFRSRSDQAFLAMAVRPSRARIEVVAGADAGPPAVISSLEVPLETVFVIDEDGRYWRAADVGTGEKKPLVASDAAAFNAWYARELVADAGPVRQQALKALKNLRGHAYATSRRAGKAAVATLGAIRWIDERADFVGPYTRSGRK